MYLAHRLFPHRQFYLRSRGSVQFFEFSPSFQLVVASVTLFLLGWIAYTSVVFVFKEQIIAAKQQEYAALRSLTQGLLSECRTLKCDLNSAIGRSDDPEGASSALRVLLRMPPAVTPEDGRYVSNPGYEAVATTWDILKGFLQDLRWVSTRGKYTDVSDDTAFGIFWGTLTALFGFLAWVLFRLFARRVPVDELPRQKSGTAKPAPNADAVKPVAKADAVKPAVKVDAARPVPKASTAKPAPKAGTVKPVA